MEFFPLTLGLAKLRPIRPERGGEPTAPHLAGDHEAWRESLSAPPEEVEEFREAEMLARLRARLPDRPCVILGEPGAGKTRLLAHWHVTWLRGLDTPRLGMAVPVLVRLRELEAGAFQGRPKEVADRLWEHGLATGAATARGCAAAALFDLPGRSFTPVWLLDGLDEFVGHAGDAALWDALAILPGTIVLTCRTAVFQQMQRDVVGRHAPAWRILGLKPGQEQTAYLSAALASEGRDHGRAEGLVRVLNGNAALRPLAASPLLLGLVAEVCDTLDLPANRAAFYEEATKTLWQRKLADRPKLRALGPERDEALAALAAAMGVARIEVGEAMLREARITGRLREALRLSGLVTFDERRELASFPHLTFQEFHLARSWLGRPLREVLDEQWANARSEEALSLLLALHDAAGRVSDVGKELRGFVERWREQHARDRSLLRRIGRSPMRVALALLGRAGIAIADPLLGAAAGPPLARLVISTMTPLHVHALVALAKDDDSSVRWTVAGNPATPPAAFAALAEDHDGEVHRRVWGNPTPTPDTLAALAKDHNGYVRWVVAGNPATPPDTLATLAKDHNDDVRRAVARNPATLIEDCWLAWGVSGEGQPPSRR